MNARPQPVHASRPAGWSDPAFARVADVVHLIAGLVFPPNRQPSAESGMRRAMSSLRMSDPDALGRAVQSPGEARDAVLAELTVGETYFFREPAQLDVLRTDILPSLMGSRDANAPLRMWSAGCASGEEAYTLAILLQEYGWPHPARILGTDVSRPRLDAARRGRYTRWSLRTVSEPRIDRWFVRRGTQFQLDPAIRAAAQFAPLNLIADDYPSLSSGIIDQDVVLCRNVLIYFDMESVARIATRLLASLAPGGWLLLGASDPPLSGLVPCEVMLTAGGVVYRRADRKPGQSQRIKSVDAAPAFAPTWASPILDAAPVPPILTLDVQAPPARPSFPEMPVVPANDDENSALAAYQVADYPRAEALAGEMLGRDPSRAELWILLIRSIANQGRLRDADEQCMRALDLHRLSPELHFLHSVLLIAAQQYREAAIAARRALYLDSHFVMAHLQLGDALARLGEMPRAARSFTNVIAELSTVTDEDVVPAADGVPASRLRHVASARLKGQHEELPV